VYAVVLEGLESFGGGFLCEFAGVKADPLEQLRVLFVVDLGRQLGKDLLRLG
jgi:hypothetical protein